MSNVQGVEHEVDRAERLARAMLDRDEDAIAQWGLDIPAIVTAASYGPSANCCA
jgi:hypothetical protein